MSRFISGGTNDSPTERDEAWRQAQAELDAKAAAAQAAAKGQQEGGKTLYETLQANKAAKQEAFEESLRLKNQFRSLDEDEVEFLDSVLESTRAKEEEVRRRTKVEVEEFRRLQDEAVASSKVDAGGEKVEDGEEGVSWAMAGKRKRKRGRGEGNTGVVGGVKIRRTSTAERKETDGADAGSAGPEDGDESTAAEAHSNGQSEKPTTATVASTAKSTVQEPASNKATTPPKASSASPPGLGLAAYSSDEDD